MDLKWSSYDFTKIPFDKINSLGQRTLLYKDLFTVSWILGRFCNYNCSYCWPYASTRKKDHRPKELIISTMDEIKKQARERGFNSFHFSFSGGEPTFHPNYLEILEHYTNDNENCNYQSCHMTTNLSQPISWFSDYLKIVKKLDRASITASWHREFAKKKQFAEKLLYLQNEGIKITINMVMVPEWFDQNWSEALFFHKKGLNVTLKPQSDKTASKVVKGYTEEQLIKLQKGMPQRNYTGHKSSLTTNKELQNFNDSEIAPPELQVELTDEKGKKWFIDQAERFNSFEFNNFKNWECSSGFRSIIIREPDGSIKRSYSCHDKPLGYIGESFCLFDEPQLCTTPSCVSSADSKIPKRKKGAKIPLYPGDTSFYNKNKFYKNSECYKNHQDFIAILNFYKKIYFLNNVDPQLAISNLLSTIELPIKIPGYSLHSLFRTFKKYPNAYWQDALSTGQILSKLWIIETLKEIGHFDLKGVYILGGWYGVFAFLLNSCKELNINWIKSFDIDPECELIADSLNKEYLMKEWKFKAVTKDMYDINYNSHNYKVVNPEGIATEFTESPDTIINTSCEHIKDVKLWSELIPKGKFIIAQGNDYFGLDSHISCTHTLEEFKENLNIERILFSDYMEFEKYKRWMVIGIK